MDGGRLPSPRAGPSSATSLPPPPYTLLPARLPPEDILFCVDLDAQARAEMRPGTGAGVSRLDAVRQALLLFCHSKLAASPDHRFAFASLGKSVAWVKKDFSSEISSAVEAVNSLVAADYPCNSADITQLFRIAAHEAKKSRLQGRLLRLVLIYCRSSVIPQFQWSVSQKTFTMDVLYLHDKPGPDNCPQKVFDTLVDALELVSECEGYILETGQGLPRVLFRHMCILVSHPIQRCVQDEVDFPKSLTRKAPPQAKDGSFSEEGLPGANNLP